MPIKSSSPIMMTETVVDDFETVEVDKQNADFMSRIIMHFFQRLFEPRHKIRAIRQARQSVVRRFILQLFFG